MRLRAPVMARLNKGVIMPTIGWQATREVLDHDVILLHLPQFDAAGISLRGRLLKKPTVVAYHSDLLLPPGAFNRFVNFVVDRANRLTARFTPRITAYTDDFADHSPYLSSYPPKRVTITPPMELAQPLAGDVRAGGNQPPIVDVDLFPDPAVLQVQRAGLVAQAEPLQQIGQVHGGQVAGQLRG